MKKLVFLLVLFSLLMSSCSSSKKVIRNDKKLVTKADKIVANAFAFKGVKYKFGGTTKRGMDCSGLIYVAYQKEQVKLERVSRFMANQGTKISLAKAIKGDLLFFKTNKSNRRINHVGLIVSVKKGIIRFIHSTTSRGVIVSSLSEKYWKNTHVKTVKIL